MKLLIGIPSYQPGGVGTVALLQALNRKKSFGYKDETGSLLTWNHNRLLALALNMKAAEGLTHLLIMHSDVEPQTPDWLDILENEMGKSEADVLSAVIPIKDGFGVTSTAIDIGPDIWAPVRLTLRQVSTLPPTFTADKLLLNTGLMLIDLRRPWVECGACFTIDDQLRQNEQGQWVAKVASEDWNFSRAAALCGARLYATSAVQLIHHGSARFSSREIWGDENDPLCKNQNREHLFMAPDGTMQALKL